MHAHPLSLNLPSRAKLWCTLQMGRQVHSPHFYSTPVCTPRGGRGEGREGGLGGGGGGGEGEEIGRGLEGGWEWRRDRESRGIKDVTLNRKKRYFTVL